MGDHPSKRSRIANEFTDQIFTSPITNVRKFENILVIAFYFTEIKFMSLRKLPFFLRQ